MIRVWSCWLGVVLFAYLVCPFQVHAAGGADHQTPLFARGYPSPRLVGAPDDAIGDRQPPDPASRSYLEAASREEKKRKQKKTPKRGDDQQASEGASTGTSPSPGRFEEGVSSSTTDRQKTAAVPPSDQTASRTSTQPALVNRHNFQTLVTPKDSLKSVGSFPTGAEGAFRYLQIEVSHSQHILKVFGQSPFGRREMLYECRVGLGASDFPTPRGDYFVTHIYDDDPLWIPPRDRAWAWGQSPSQRVYGGTMAPLLKKRSVKSKKTTSTTQDLVEGKVKLDDYGYRFHGTNAPRSIGRNESHGCVRMLPEDARKVSALIKEHIGTVDRKGSENGTYVVLRAPVRLSIVR